MSQPVDWSHPAAESSSPTAPVRIPTSPSVQVSWAEALGKLRGTPPFSFAASRLGAETARHNLMDLSRKDFLLRSTAAVIPASLAASVLGTGADSTGSSAPGFPQFNVRQFGARGDGLAKDTKPIQAAIDAAGALGGTVYFPAGKYLSGTVRLKSQVTLFLDAGAALVASPGQGGFRPLREAELQVLLRRRDDRFLLRAGAGTGRGTYRDCRPRHY